LQNTEPIIVEQSFDASLERVWKAITDAEQMRQWYFPNIPEFRPELGFETQFLIQNEGRNFTHIWKIKEVIPQKLIGYSWNFEEYSGEGYSIFELIEKNEQILLRLKSMVIEPFPEDIPEFERESGLNGWQYLINQSLPNYMNNAI